jgi:hypothetical protein
VRRSVRTTSRIFSGATVGILAATTVLAALVWLESSKAVPGTDVAPLDDSTEAEILIPDESMGCGSIRPLELAHSPIFIGGAALALFGAFEFIRWGNRRRIRRRHAGRDREGPR